MRGNSEHPLRAEADRAFQGARRDRGDRLYIARSQVSESALLETERRGSLLALYPTYSGLAALEEWLLARASAEETYLRFRDANADEEDTRLLLTGIKRMEAGATQEETAAYRAAVAGRAARLLREKNREAGGTLYLCALIVNRMEKTAGGMKDASEMAGTRLL